MKNKIKLRFRYTITAHTQTSVLLRCCEMASTLADQMVREMANVLKERRVKIGASNPHFPALRADALALSGASRRKQIPSSHEGLGSLKLWTIGHGFQSGLLAPRAHTYL